MIKQSAIVVGLGIVAVVTLTGCGVGLRSPIQFPDQPGPGAATTVVRPTAAPAVRPPANPATPSDNPNPAPPSNTTKVSNNCPSLAEARRLMGVDLTLIGEESCAYTFNSGDGSMKPVNTPTGWLYNTAEPDQLVYVGRGDGSTQKIQAKAATWRKESEYPGLSLEKQFELLSGYAALPQNQFAGSVRCRGCVGFTPNAPASSGNNPAVLAPAAQPAPAVAAPPKSEGCPDISGFTSKPIEGGCVYNADAPARFAIPSGWFAHYGVPAVDVDGPAQTEPGRQFSLYKR